MPLVIRATTASADSARVFQDCMQRLSETSKEFADVCQVFCTSLSDDQLTDNELAKIEREGGQLIAAIHELMKAARAKNVQSKPALVRAA